MKNKDLLGKILVVFLAFALILIICVGEYKDKKMLTENKKKADISNREISEQMIENYKKNQDIKDNLPQIYCWGDSLTAGAGGKGINYPTIVSNLTNLKVFNYGVGGEGAKTIAIRQGAIPLYVESFTIPTDNTKVEVSLFDDDGKIDNLLRQGDSGINPCTIDGIEGTISRDEADGKYYFQRSSNGEEKTINSNTQIITQAMTNKNSDNDIVIIFSGTNNCPNTENIDEIINIQKQMISYANTNKYIIVGLTSKSYMEQVAEVNEILKNEYGEHFIDIRQYLLEHGLKDANIEASEQDIVDMQNGEIPASLRSDDVHGTSDFYKIIGEQIYNKILELNYITEEQKEYLGIN